MKQLIQLDKLFTTRC